MDALCMKRCLLWVEQLEKTSSTWADAAPHQAHPLWIELNFTSHLSSLRQVSDVSNNLDSNSWRPAKSGQEGSPERSSFQSNRPSEGMCKSPGWGMGPGTEYWVDSQKTGQESGPSSWAALCPHTLIVHCSGFQTLGPSELPGRLMKTQGAEPYLQSFWFNKLRRGPRISLIKWYCYSEDHTLKISHL